MEASSWDRGAATYDSSRGSDSIYLSCTRQIATRIPKRVRVCLDAGCGTGISTTAVRARSDEVVAVDYSMASLHILRSKGLRNTLLVRADLKALPFKESTFDACVCANALQHMRPGAPQRTVVEELRRVTKRGHPIAVSVHHYSREKRRAGWIKEGKPGQQDIDYIFRFSRAELMGLMPRASIRAAGFPRLLKLPFLGSRVQDSWARFVGKLAARLGDGHMLVAVERNRKLGS